MKQAQREIEANFKRLEKVTDAFEKAAGIEVQVDEDLNGGSYQRRKCDCLPLQKLYRKAEFKPLIDMFINRGGIDKKALGLN